MPILCGLSWLVPLVAAALAPAPTDLADRIHAAGATCDGPALSERVRAQLDAGAGAGNVVADATLHRRGDGQWQLDVEIVRGDGEPTVRTFVAPECGTAMDAAALVIALAIVTPEEAGVPEGPAVAEPVTEVPPPPESAVAATDSTVTSAPASGSAVETEGATGTASPPTADTPAATRARRFRGLLRAGGGVDVGALPGAAAFFEAAGGALGRRWRAEITGAYRLQSTDRATLDPRAGGRFSTWAIGVRGCGVPTKRLRSGATLEFPLCGGLEGGRMIVEGFGFDGARTARRPWSAASGGAGLAWAPRPNIALVLQAALGVPLVRSVIEIEGLERLHQTGAVFGRVGLGVEGRFP